VLPTAGTITDKVHRLPLRIYYEDTDVSGLVYHANYLRYFERARSDMIRLIGMDQAAMLAAPLAERLFFAVRSIQIEYIKPARYDDALVVESRLVELGAASLIMLQRLLRGEQLLCEARVRAAFLGGEGMPRRLPAAARSAMVELLVSV
jgi:acyl-CoA thioester hydrolase